MSGCWMGMEIFFLHDAAETLYCNRGLLLHDLLAAQTRVLC